MKYLRTLISVGIIFLVFGATLAGAVNPIKLLNRDDSNLSWLLKMQTCAADKQFGETVEMVLDNAGKSSSTVDSLASQMMQESMSRHIRVSILAPDIENKNSQFLKTVRQNHCYVGRISEMNPSNREFVVDTFSYQNNTLSDFVEVIDMCRHNIATQGKCVLVVRPHHYVSGNQVDLDKYDYFMQAIKALAAEVR